MECGGSAPLCDRSPSQTDPLRVVPIPGKLYVDCGAPAPLLRSLHTEQPSTGAVRPPANAFSSSLSTFNCRLSTSSPPRVSEHESRFSSHFPLPPVNLPFPHGTPLHRRHQPSHPQRKNLGRTPQLQHRRRHHPRHRPQLLRPLHPPDQRARHRARRRPHPLLPHDPHRAHDPRRTQRLHPFHGRALLPQSRPPPHRLSRSVRLNLRYPPSTCNNVDGSSPYPTKSPCFASASFRSS